MSRKLATLNELFGIDCRSLALFRICLGLVVLFDLAVRFSDLTIFYTDAGVLPRASLLNHTSNPWTISIYLMNGTTLVQAILFFIQGVCAVGLILGYRTRWMVILSWFLMASLQRRNPLILGGADNYLRMMLFWSMFVPLGARYSLDSALKTSSQQSPVRILSWGTAAILLQTVLVYIFTALHKWQGNTWLNGSALYYTLNLDLYAKKPTEILLLFPALLTGITHAVLWVESIGPFLLFCPVFMGPVRTLMVFGFMLMQLGFNVLLYLQLFPAVSAVALILFLPSWFWDRWAVFRQPQSELIGTAKQPLAANAVAAFFLFLTFFWVTAQFMPSKLRIPKPLYQIGTLFYIDQAWKMFAPNPANISGWLVVPGVLADGTILDISRNGASVNWEKPSQQFMFKNERWRKYLVHFSLGTNQRVWMEYAQYLCRSWNDYHPDKEKLQSLEIDLMARKTPPEGENKTYNKRILLRYDCMAGPSKKLPQSSGSPQKVYE